MSDEIQRTLDEILRQTKATNGRVTALEFDMRDVKDKVGDFSDVLYGDEDRREPGLVAQSKDVHALLGQWRTMTSVLKWVAGTFGVAAVGLLGNLVGAGL